MKSSVLIFLGSMSNKLLVNRDKILNFLRANYDKGYCDDCLSARLEIYPRQQVNQICRQLYATKSIFRNIGTCTSCGRDKIINIAKAHIQTEVKSQAVIKENQIVQNVSHWDKSLEWFWEGNVLEKIVEYMINVEGFEILLKSDTEKRKHGPDILARKGNILRYVAVKGYPSLRYIRDFPGGRKGELKRTAPATQARHWFSEALFELILQKSKNERLEIALGLPKFPTYVRFLNQIKSFREKIGLYCYLLDKDGKVELVQPSEQVNENLIKNAASSLSDKVKQFFTFQQGGSEPLFLDPYSKIELLIKNQQPVYSLHDLQIYDVTRATKGRVRAYAYIDNLKKICKLLPEEEVKKCMNAIIEHIYCKTIHIASVNECFEISNATWEIILTSILLLYKKGAVSLQKQGEKFYIKLRLHHYEHLKALGLEISRGPVRVLHPPAKSGLGIIEDEHKQIFKTLAEEERKRIETLREN